MAIQKKHGKGRLDKYYRLAKEKGFRARSAFKLIQLNKKYGFLEKSKVALDLCAAPGGWCQVCSQTMPQGSIIVGIDLVPIKPLPNVIALQGDITADDTRAKLRGHLKTWKADVVLHDGAPNVGTAWIQDSFNQAELVLYSLKLATEFLIEGGTFVSKIFRSRAYNPLLWVLQQLFTKVEATKPPSSRSISAEIFVVCQGYKAPRRIDPRLLDPQFVLAEINGTAPNVEAKVFHPEVKKRKREGYEEGDYTQYKEVPASNFIESADPITILGSVNCLSFNQDPGNEDVVQLTIDKLPQTTPEIRSCCADLKVLGRSDFKRLLKWRTQVRDILGLNKSKKPVDDTSEEIVQVESMTEELESEQALQALREQQRARNKRARRRENEKKQKDLIRMQMHMTVPTDIGMQDVGSKDADGMFRLKHLDEHEKAMHQVRKGRMVLVHEASPASTSERFGNEPSDDIDGNGNVGDIDDNDLQEEELNSMYELYKAQISAKDPKYRARMAREDHDDDWEGISGNEDDASDTDQDVLEEGSDSDSDSTRSDIDEEARGGRLLRDLDTEPSSSSAPGLSKRARNFFDNDIFQSILTQGEMAPRPLETPAVGASDFNSTPLPQKRLHTPAVKILSTSDMDDSGSSDHDDNQNQDDEWAPEHANGSGSRIDIDLVTAEAMTLAHELASGRRTKHDIVDDGFNKHSFNDRDGIPEWFLDDESKHSKPLKPITKAAADAIKEKMRALNARPIKKVAEAKARKKMRAVQRLEKMKKKSALLMEDEGMTEREKAESIMKTMRKASGKVRPRKPVTVVRATGATRGPGRPRGVKGRYKMVDARMKKETRALRRVAQKSKK